MEATTVQTLLMTSSWPTMNLVMIIVACVSFGKGNIMRDDALNIVSSYHRYSIQLLKVVMKSMTHLPDYSGKLRGRALGSHDEGDIHVWRW